MWMSQATRMRCGMGGCAPIWIISSSQTPIPRVDASGIAGWVKNKLNAHEVLRKETLASRTAKKWKARLLTMPISEIDTDNVGTDNVDFKY